MLRRLAVFTRPLVLVALAAPLMPSAARAGEAQGRTIHGSPLDHVSVTAPSIPKDATIVVKKFSADNADLGTGGKESNEKRHETAEAMKAAAPGDLSAGLVQKLTELKIFKAVVEASDAPLPDGAIVVDGEFTLLNPGSRAARAWVGMGAGRSKVCVKGRFLDAKGNVLGTFEHCRSGAGAWSFYGGNAAAMMSVDMVETGDHVARFLANWANGDYAK